MLKRLKTKWPHRSWCEIDRSALRHNLRALAAITSAPEVMPMVKADAYGHGMIESAKVFAGSGAAWIGCANIHEGMALRASGITLPILLLSGFLPEEIPAVIEYQLTLTLSSLEEARQVASLAKRRKTTAAVQVKIDTGMGRLGVPLEGATKLIHTVWNDPHLVLTGVYSHYACSDTDPAKTREQWERFQGIASPAGIPRHICNSAGLLAFPSTAGDLIRPGVAVYGISPLPRFQSMLRPAMTWKSRLVGVRTVPRGTPLSYGATFTTPRSMRIGLASVGYGDGLFRSLSNKGEVLVGGKRCRILGRVTMDQILLDLGRVPNAAKGDEVVLLGQQGREVVLATEMARKAGTISYEVWCHITDRVSKIYT